MHAALVADLHGSHVQYQLLRKAVSDFGIDALFIAGDIGPGLTPKEWLAPLETKKDADVLSRDGKLPAAWGAHLVAQRQFYNYQLPTLLGSLPAQVYLIQGNDDARSCLPLLQSHEPRNGNAHGWYEMHGRRVPLGEEFDAVGYACVPHTPHVLKDWERPDCARVSQDRRALYDSVRNRARFAGIVGNGHASNGPGWIRSSINDPSCPQQSIAEDLAAAPYANHQTTNGTRPKRSIWLFHTPPYNTALDQLDDNRRIGSFAVRDAIEREQPYLFLCGHIHGTVDKSGSYIDRIGQTICLGPGNNRGPHVLSMITFDSENPGEAKRHLLRVLQ